MKTKILFIAYKVCVALLTATTKLSDYLDRVVIRIEAKLPPLTDKEINNKLSE